MADMQPRHLSYPFNHLTLNLRCQSAAFGLLRDFKRQGSSLQGFSLTELCVVLAISGIAAVMAAPTVSQWLWRARVENTIRSWAADLQSARLHAMRTGQALQFQRTTQCSAATLPNGDWRCGWETVRISGSERSAVFSNALNGELSVLLSPSQNMLPINPEGEPVAGGLRLVVKPRLNSSPWVVSACINTAGRLRLVNAGSCS
jgi:prepilin-type N-terminal cleavage/methylation domain-containing protein